MISAKLQPGKVQFCGNLINIFRLVFFQNFIYLFLSKIERGLSFLIFCSEIVWFRGMLVCGPGLYFLGEPPEPNQSMSYICFLQWSTRIHPYFELYA